MNNYSMKGNDLGEDPNVVMTEKHQDFDKQYNNIIKELAKLKRRQNNMFNGILGAKITKLSSLGYEISREKILKDIEKEMNKQALLEPVENNQIDEEIFLDVQYSKNMHM